jgi:glucose-6-phosphate 1-dehydrogenase
MDYEDDMSGHVHAAARLSQAPHAPAGALRRAEPCVLVIFGAGGDLTRRKLMPSLFHLMGDGLLGDTFHIVGVGREGPDHESFRETVRGALEKYRRGQGREMDAEHWRHFRERLHYVGGDLTKTETYAALGRQLSELDRTLPEGSGHLFYLAIPPSFYPAVIQQLAQSGVAPRRDDPRSRPWTRIVIEKPFGRSLETAQALNATVRRDFAEHQVYRIDHYLGKETVQNLLVFRFANSIFEPIWNRQHVHHVQITAAESVGVEGRARYYEEAGVVRDMFQNHLLQLLALTAMEPPVAFNADAVRDEKLKVLRSIRPLEAPDAAGVAVRGQYGPGTAGGAAAAGYRDEQGVAKESTTPTFAAVRFMLDNWRWNGVPFYLRSGKRLPARTTEIAIQFRRPPHLMFPLPDGRQIAPNVLAIRIQPEEGIALRFEVKVPGMDVRLASVDMDFDYSRGFDVDAHDAYETLLLDCMLGEATLFTRSDEAETAWGIVDPLIAHWERVGPHQFPNYAAGSWGPAAADALIASSGARWRELAG